MSIECVFGAGALGEGGDGVEGVDGGRRGEGKGNGEKVEDLDLTLYYIRTPCPFFSFLRNEWFSFFAGNL